MAKNDKTMETVTAEVTEAVTAELPELEAVDPGEELVEVQLFKDGNRYSEDVLVQVNGENCLIKRGVPVMVKRKFAEVLQHSAEHDAQYAMEIEKRVSE